MANFFTLQTLNILTYLWFTAANVFAFTLSFGWRDHTDIDPPDQWKYGYGIGKETYLTPSPWIYAVLFVVHILFAGTLAFAQWSEKGRDILIGGLSYRWPVLMVLSTFWTGTWLRQWYYTSWILAVAVAILAIETSRTIKRRYRLEYELDTKEEVFVHTPFSLFEGWAIFILAVNTFAAFASVSLFSGLTTRIFAVWFFAILAGFAYLAAFSYTTGDVPLTFMLVLGQFAIFSHQITRDNTNHQHLIAWFVFAFAIISVWALAYSVW